MSRPFTIGSGITFGAGIEVSVPPILKLSLDASTYSNTTTGPQQNVSGTSDNIGFFPYGWPAYSAIQPGWTCVQTGAVVTVVDGVNHTIVTVGTPFTSGSTYTFTSSVSWIDSISNLTFILNNGVTYDSGDGGSLVFVPSSGQYAQSPTSLSDLSTWTVEVWHYYTGSNTGASPCIITELYPGSTGKINYFMGALDSSTTNLETGYFNGGFQITPGGYNLTAGNWYQIIGTYDGKQVKLYVNNILVGQTTASGSQPISSQGGINLMRRWDNPEYWGGKLAIVKVYQNAMNASRVNASWNANKARFGLAPSFTLTSADMTGVSTGYGAEGDTTGFSIGGNFNSTQACYNPTLTAGKQAELTAFWNDNGLSVGGATYLFDVTWGSGSSTNTTRNVMVIGSETSYLVTGTVDTNVTGWDTPGQNPLNSPNMKAANGTFMFPATFSLISPTIQDSIDWC
jgi:hypothetical protein